MNFKKKENINLPYQAPARTIKNKSSSPALECLAKMPRYGSVVDSANEFNFQTLLQYVYNSKFLDILKLFLLS